MDIMQIIQPIKYVNLVIKQPIVLLVVMNLVLIIVLLVNKDMSFNLILILNFHNVLNHVLMDFMNFNYQMDKNNVKNVLLNA